MATLDAQYGSDAPPPPLHLFSIFSKITADSLRLRARREKIDLEAELLSENMYQLSIRLRRRFVQGFLITSGSLWTVLIKPSESSALAEQVSRIALRNLYPSLASAYVESEQLLDFLDQLGSLTPNASLQIKDYFLRSAREGTTKRAWPRGQPYVRKKIEEEMGRKFLLDGITFNLVSDNATIEARVSRDGHFVLYGGKGSCYSTFNRIVYQPILEIMVKNSKRFQNRGRKVIHGEPVISPIRIDPGIELQGDSLRALKLSLIQQYSSAVIHDTNPWLMMSAIDRKDSSYYDIYGYHDQIVVVPFERASAESISRLYSLIREMFPSAKLVSTDLESSIAQ